MKLPNECRVVECGSIEISSKDIIYIKEEKDFCWLAHNYSTIFKSDKSYYLMSDSVVYIFVDG